MSDKEYLVEYLDESLLKQEEEPSDNVNAVFLIECNPDAFLNEKNENIPSRAEWSEESTNHLMALYKENIKLLGKDKKFITFNKLWQHIAAKMREKGYMYNANQVKKKWHSIIRAYKDTIKNGSKIAQKRKEFEEQFDKIFEKPKTRSKKKSRVSEDSDESENENMQYLLNSKKDNPRTPESIEKLKTRNMRKLMDTLQEQHREKMEATEKWRRQKLSLKKICEQNRHKERLLLIEAFVEQNENT